MSRGEVVRCLREHRTHLRVTHEARAFLNGIVSETLPGPMLNTQRYRPTWAAVAGLAYATLPAWARNCYGPPPPGSSAALSQAATTVALHALRDSLLGRTAQQVHTPPADGVTVTPARPIAGDTGDGGGTGEPGNTD